MLLLGHVVLRRHHMLTEVIGIGQSCSWHPRMGGGQIIELGILVAKGGRRPHKGRRKVI